MTCPDFVCRIASTYVQHALSNRTCKIGICGQIVVCSLSDSRIWFERGMLAVHERSIPII